VTEGLVATLVPSAAERLAGQRRGQASPLQPRVRRERAHFATGTILTEWGFIAWIAPSIETLW